MKERESSRKCKVKAEKEKGDCIIKRNKKTLFSDVVDVINLLINKILLQNKPSSTASTVSVNAKASTETSSGKLSVSARRAQFQASRRIMSAPIRPLNQLEDAKNKRKPRKKKVIR